MNEWYPAVINYKSSNGFSWPEMARRTGVNERSLRNKESQLAQKNVLKLQQFFKDQTATSELLIQVPFLSLEKNNDRVSDMLTGIKTSEVKREMNIPKQSREPLQENAHTKDIIAPADMPTSEEPGKVGILLNENKSELVSDHEVSDTQAEQQELFIPVFGFIWLSPEEITILNHPAVQRLGRINQLGQSYLVYRGATHKRLEHVIGTVHVAQLMIEAVYHSSQKAKLQQKSSGRYFTPQEQHFIRLGALLHDVGHIVAGHTIEDEMCLVCKHDSDERLDKILTDPEGNWNDSEGSSLAHLIDREYQKYLPSTLIKNKITPSELLRLLIRKPIKKHDNDMFHDKQKILETCSEIRLGVCRDIIGNTICSDLLDYLYRDWYHIGKTKTFDVRILQYMEIRPQEESIDKFNPVAKPSDQLIINLGRRPKIRTDAVSQILDLLEWRYQLSESVLFHRTKLAAEAMLDRALYEIWGTDAKSAEKFLLKLGEDELYPACKIYAEQKGEKGKVPALLLDALQKRQLFSSLCTYSYFDLPRDAQSKILKQYSGDSESSGVSPATNRNKLLRLLENDFGLTPGSLAMFCPGGSMKAKLAEVKVAIGEEVSSFSDYEKTRDEQLSAGHLQAQILRFERLWRIHFFIQSAEKKRIEPWIGELKEAIFKLGLGQLQAHEDDGPEPIAIRIAQSLTAIVNSPWQGRLINKEPVTAAYLGESAATGMYPFGAHSIRSFIKDEPNRSRT